MAYQDREADEHNVCEEVSWFRESWRSCLKLAPIRVHWTVVSLLPEVWQWGGMLTEVRVEYYAQTFPSDEEGCD